jgi:hypothetical protein
VTQIGAATFLDCTFLASITLAASVTHVAEQAFLGYASLHVSHGDRAWSHLGQHERARYHLRVEQRHVPHRVHVISAWPVLRPCHSRRSTFGMQAFSSVARASHTTGFGEGLNSSSRFMRTEFQILSKYAHSLASSPGLN